MPYDNTFPITHRLWINSTLIASRGGDEKIAGWAIAGALGTGGNVAEQTAYLVVDANEAAPRWILERDIESFYIRHD
jgi:hypothetical protein